jgi:hypothetical protein
MTLWRRQEYGNKKRISGCQELGGGSYEWAKHRGFLEL